MVPLRHFVLRFAWLLGPLAIWLEIRAASRATPTRFAA